MKEKTQWHPAFCSAVKLELKASKMYLEYRNEYNLNTKPIQIDLLIVKKPPNAIIENEIGKIFRGHNIMEYKSPEDEMNVDTYFKTLAYAYLYKSSGAKVDEIKYEDITISLVRKRKPMKLLSWFQMNKYEVFTEYKGIYEISKDGYPPTQIIVSSELDKGSHTWLTALTSGMEEADVERFIRNIENLEEKDEKEFADSVLQVSMKENARAFDIAKEVPDMCEALRELMKPELEEAKTEGMAEMIIEYSMEYNLTEDQTLERLKKKLNIGDAKAKEYLKKFN